MKLFLLLTAAFQVALTAQPDYKFPDSFLFGTATAAFQVEGGWDADGKGPNIWDVGLETHRTSDGSDATVACDSYHDYEDDVRLLKDLGVDFYRFSIAWSRVLPDGKISNINQKGIDYYNNLIDLLVENNILPFVTLYHWDLPEALQDEGGWIERKLIDYYSDYADLVFKTYGDRVKHWMTFNEIMWICEGGYSEGSFAPFISHSGTDCYTCAHVVLLSHAKAFRLYESKYKAQQNGQIGIAIDSSWHEPNSDSAQDKEASDQAMHMQYGWFINPIVYGNYPDIMISRIANLSQQQGLSQSRLPVFTADEQTQLKGSYNFLGLNHYTTDKVYFANAGTSVSHWTDTGVQTYQDPSWPGSASSWLKVVPWGIHNIVVWIKDHYNNSPLLITESGFSDHGDLQDTDRADYYRDYLYELARAINDDNVNLIGYTAWSLIDNFEWMEGYSQRFGLHYVNFTDPKRTRTRKLSSYVYNNIITTKHIDFDYSPKWPPAK